MSLSEKVHNLFLDCLFKDDEIQGGQPPKDAVLIDGLTRKFGLHPGRLTSHTAELKEIIAQMPKEFFKGTGDGMSFLNLCMTKDGEQWAEHPTMEELVVMALGLKLASYVMPRSMWAILPGGVPYIVFEI